MNFDTVSHANGYFRVVPPSLATTAPAAAPDRGDALGRLGNTSPHGAVGAPALDPMSVEGLMEEWGAKNSRYDFDADGTVGMQDLLMMLSKLSAGPDPGPEVLPKPTGTAPTLDAAASATPGFGVAAPAAAAPEGAPTPGSATVEGLLEAWGATGSKYDLDGDGTVNMADLLALLSRQSGTAAPDAPPSMDPTTVDGLLDAWGTNDAHYDFDGNGTVDMADLLALLSRLSANPEPDLGVAVAPVMTPEATPAAPTVDGLMDAWGTADAVHDLDGNGTVNMADLLALLSQMSGPAKTGASSVIATVTTTDGGPANPIADLGDALIEQFERYGYTEHPPSNLRELVMAYDLGAMESRALFQYIQAHYPEGLGVNVTA